MNRIGGILRDTPQKIRSRPQDWEATEISQEPIESQTSAAAATASTSHR